MKNACLFTNRFLDILTNSIVEVYIRINMLLLSFMWLSWHSAAWYAKDRGFKTRSRKLFYNGVEGVGGNGPIISFSGRSAVSSRFLTK